MSNTPPPVAPPAGPPLPLQVCGDRSQDTPWAEVSNGRVCWNPERNAQKWALFRLLVNASSPFSLPAGLQQTAAHIVSPEGTASGDTEFAKLRMVTSGAGGAQARFTVLLWDSKSKRQYMNVPVLGSHVYGVASLDAEQAQTIYVAAECALQATILNLEAVDTTYEGVAFGRRFVGADGRDIEERRRLAWLAQRIHPYWLGNDTGAVIVCEAGATVTWRGTTPSNAYFVARHPGLDDSTGDYRVTITDGSSQRSFSDGPLHRDLVFARTFAVAGFPQGAWRAASSVGQHPVPWTQAFPPNTQVTMTVTDISGAQNRIRITMPGSLIYVDERGRPLLDPGQRAQAVGQPYFQRR